MPPGGQMAVGARVWPRSRNRLSLKPGGDEAETTLLAGSAYAAEDYGKSFSRRRRHAPVKFEIQSSKSETPAGESAKLPGGVWRTRSWLQVIPGDHLPGRKRASPPLLNASRLEFLDGFSRC